MPQIKTYIYVEDAVDVGALFTESVRYSLFLGGSSNAPEEVNRLFGDDPIRNTEFMVSDPEEGLPSMVALWYRTGGVAVTEEEATTWSEQNNGDTIVPCTVALGLSTHILWHDPARKWNAGHLQASMVWQIGGWLDARKLAWKWNTNVTGQLYTGYEKLDDYPVWVSKYLHPQRQGLSMEVIKKMLFGE